MNLRTVSIKVSNNKKLLLNYSKIFFQTLLGALLLFRVRLRYVVIDSLLKFTSVILSSFCTLQSNAYESNAKELAQEYWKLFKKGGRQEKTSTEILLY